jgi:hypothetical protein
MFRRPKKPKRIKNTQNNLKISKVILATQKVWKHQKTQGIVSKGFNLFIFLTHVLYRSY